MSYIQPNTTILLLKGVGIDSSYQHTIYFGSVNQQTDYFKSKRKHTLTANTYQRPFKNVCRVALLSDECVDCNYMMFQNDSFGDKWFYAFIEKVEYINNNACEIYYQIDVMQTWMFDYTLRECFVEREHVMSDKLFEHRVEEGLETGDYVNLWDKSLKIDYGALCGYYLDGINNDIIENIYSPLMLKLYDYVNDNNDLGRLKFVFEAVQEQGNPQLVALLKLAPLKCIQYEGYTGNNKPRNVEENFNVPFVYYMGNVSTNSTYLPRNKKLYTKEFCFLSVRNNLGKTQDYSLELFKHNVDKSVDLQVMYCCYPAPCVLIAPKNYNEYDGNNIYEGISYDVFPPLVWIGSTYSRWDELSYQTNQARNGFNLVMGAIAGINNIVSSASGYIPSNNMVGQTLGKAYKMSAHNDNVAGQTGNSVISTISNVGNSLFDIQSAMIQNQNHKLKATTVQGSCGEVALDFTFNDVKFDIIMYGLTHEFAKKIDWFFDVYGYKVNTIKIPNISGRPFWNYVKTVGSNVKAVSIPNEDVVTINNIFNNGITFWKDGDIIGDYADYDNRLPEDIVEYMELVNMLERGEAENEQTEE